MALPREYRQSYCCFKPDEKTGECSYFWPIKKLKDKMK